MKKISVIAFIVSLLTSLSANAGEEYSKCLDANYTTNDGLIKCAEEETNRVMTELDKRYFIVSGHKFFRPWNSADHSFAELKTAWLKYRDDSCNLLGYSLIKGNDDYGRVEEARCKMRETLRFREEIETLVKNYQKTLKPKGYN